MQGRYGRSYRHINSGFILRSFAACMGNYLLFDCLRNDSYMIWMRRLQNKIFYMYVRSKMIGLSLSRMNEHGEENITDVWSLLEGIYARCIRKYEGERKQLGQKR